MTFAVPMLGGIVLQLIFAYLMVMKGNGSATTLHKHFGVVLLVIILSCVGLRTLSLGFCDIQGKRCGDRNWHHDLRCQGHLLCGTRLSWPSHAIYGP